MPDERVHRGEHGQEHRQTINEADGVSGADGDFGRGVWQFEPSRARECATAGRCSGCLRPTHARQSRVGGVQRVQSDRSATRKARSPVHRRVATWSRDAGGRRCSPDGCQRMCTTAPGGPYRPRAASGRVMASRPSVRALVSQETVIVSVSIGTRFPGVAIQVADRRGGQELQVEHFSQTVPALVVHHHVAGF